MSSEINQMLFSGQRPDTLDMLSMMQAGLEPEHLAMVWEKAGGVAPNLDKLQREIATIMPYVGLAVKTVLDAHDSDEELLLFAARDAENLYDLAQILGPKANTKLLPASSAFWGDHAWHTSPETGAKFLAAHGMDFTEITDEKYQFRIVDTAFAGSVARHLFEAVKKTYGIDIRPKLHASLICQSSFQSYIDVGQIIPDDYRNDPEYKKKDLPLTGRIDDQADEYGGDSRRRSFRCAVALQCMPRYHGPYTKIGEAPERELPTRAVAESQFELPHRHLNSSIIHPYAAAVAQMAFIHHGLELAA